MTEAQRIELLERAKGFIRNELAPAHILGLKKASQLKNYNVNPFLYKYLANFLRGNSHAESIAEALIYPRILGSSITTSFGMRIQNFISTLFQGYGSVIGGIDIEFIDAIDNRKKYCQIKSGPNTINSDDVDTIIGHFRTVRGIARQNRANIGLDDLIVGVVYGEPNELSSNYLRLNESHPVYIGKDFWHRLTGKDDFYLDLINAMGEVALEFDASEQLTQAIDRLENQINETLAD